MLRNAAALILLRDTGNGLEVCMLRRVTSSRFAAGAYVFPGGSVDTVDAELSTKCIANAVQNEGDKAYKVAAIRETFEEAGILAAATSEGVVVDHQLREQLHQGSLSLEALLLETGLQVDLSALMFYDHWITPEAAPIRFDTRFYVSAARDEQDLVHDEKETDSSCWAKPVDILALYDSNDVKLMPVTHVQLTRLAKFNCVADVMAYAEALEVVKPTMPVMSLVDNGKSKIVTIDLPEGVLKYPIYK